jgi:hypothetical protein
MLGNIGLDNGFEGVSPLTLRGPSAEAWRSIRESEQAMIMPGLLLRAS